MGRGKRDVHLRARLLILLLKSEVLHVDVKTGDSRVLQNLAVPRNKRRLKDRSMVWIDRNLVRVTSVLCTGLAGKSYRKSLL